MHKWGTKNSLKQGKGAGPGGLLPFMLEPPSRSHALAHEGGDIQVFAINIDDAVANCVERHRIADGHGSMRRRGGRRHNYRFRNLFDHRVSRWSWLWLRFRFHDGSGPLLHYDLRSGNEG